MTSGPDITRIARLIGEPARANMLGALMSGQALSAGELARIAGVQPATASSHLSHMLDAGLLETERQGRHRYFRLKDHYVAEAIENLIQLAEHTGHTRFQPGPRDPELRRARVCYDHLAGEMGVELYDRLARTDALTLTDGLIELSPWGFECLTRLGVELASLEASKRAICRTCLDWSVRRHHLAGALGALLLQTFIDKGWMVRHSGSRVLRVTRAGERDWPRFLDGLRQRT